jgi:hypothetical protein
LNRRLYSASRGGEGETVNYDRIARGWGNIRLPVPV